jgi:hypothetical protein
VSARQVNPVIWSRNLVAVQMLGRCGPDLNHFHVKSSLRNAMVGAVKHKTRATNACPETQRPNYLHR